MWERARQEVEDTFFKDEIYLYKNTVTADDLGEELETQSLVGTYKCNIENSQNNYQENVSGTSVPQTIRISLAKATPLSYSDTYKVKIKTARIVIDAAEYWKVAGWVEGQISTVITANREVSV